MHALLSAPQKKTWCWSFPGLHLAAMRAKLSVVCHQIGLEQLASRRSLWALKLDDVTAQSTINYPQWDQDACCTKRLSDWSSLKLSRLEESSSNRLAYVQAGIWKSVKLHLLGQRIDLNCSLCSALPALKLRNVSTILYGYACGECWYDFALLTWHQCTWAHAILSHSKILWKSRQS